MRMLRSLVTALYLAIILGCWLLVWSTLPVNGHRQLPMEPLHTAGQSVTPAYEGWFKNPNGGFCLLFGYFNRNLKEELDIPVGPNNNIEPGGPDQGQPTHFLPQRQWGLFTVTVPENFGTDKLVWTLVVNGQTTSVPAHLDARWAISPLFDVGVGNTPPLISFEQGGPTAQGPLGSVPRSRQHCATRSRSTYGPPTMPRPFRVASPWKLLQSLSHGANIVDQAR